MKQLLSLLTLLQLTVSCEHRPLTELNTGHYIRIYLDEEIKNVTCGFYNEEYERPEYKRPTVLRVLFADPETDDIVAERYLRGQGEDQRGHYIDGNVSVPRGNYNFLVYSFGTEMTQVRNEQSYYRIEAYTPDIDSRHYNYFPTTRMELDGQKIVYEPDHLFHELAEPIHISPSGEADTLRNEAGEYFTAHSIALSYYLQIRVKGIRWVTSAASLMSGMAGSTLLHGHRMMVETDPVHLFFQMKRGEVTRSNSSEGDMAVLYTTFNTFGKLPDQSTVYTLHLEFVKTDGTSQVEKIDITPMFDTPLVQNEQWILLDHEIEITPPEGGGGMTPGVEGWEDEEVSVPL